LKQRLSKLSAQYTTILSPRQQKVKAVLKLSHDKVVKALRRALNSTQYSAIYAALKDAAVLVAHSKKGRAECIKTEDQIVKNPILVQKCKASMWETIWISPFLVQQVKHHFTSLKFHGNTKKEFSQALSQHSGSELSAAIAAYLNHGALGGLSRSALENLSPIVDAMYLNKTIARGKEKALSTPYASFSASKLLVTPASAPTQPLPGLDERNFGIIRSTPAHQIPKKGLTSSPRIGVPRFATEAGLGVMCQFGARSGSYFDLPFALKP
jgi:hypothetical protein